MKVKSMLGMLILTAWFLLPPESGISQAMERPLAGHVVYGMMTVANDHTNDADGDYDILIVGADAQKPLGGRRLKVGYETGALFSIDSDIRQVYASSGEEGGKVYVSMDVNSILIDYFFGGFVSIEPVSWVRLYVGAGPLLIWSRWETETSNAAQTGSESDSGFGVGVYARAGVDLFFTPKMGLTIGTRINATTLSLDDKQGRVDVEGWQYYFGISARF